MKENPFAASAAFFRHSLQQFQYFNKYARFDWNKGRRETWIETVDRAVVYLRELSENKLKEQDYQDIHSAILNMEAMPSMRLLAMAGEPARRNNLAIYNCSYLAVDRPGAFVEALIISMNGCGVGFSVEDQYISQLPSVSEINHNPPKTHVVGDSADGWAEALREGLFAWFHGFDIEFDYSQIRPTGAILRTKGGRASGPEPLQNMLAFLRETIQGAAGRKLTSLECHDMMCEVGNAAVQGGSRRTAMISLFDVNDQAMLNAKHGEFNERRWNANNSAVFNNARDHDTQTTPVMNAMHNSQRGEPGIVSRWAMRHTIPARRQLDTFGTNPCAEIILRSRQLCNLSIVVARADDTYETLARKVRIATLIGTIQSTATYFPGMSPEWKENCEQERLLGVDITGQRDCPVLNERGIRQHLLNVAIETNRIYALKLGINQSAAITCVKPSGNSSVLLDCASGLHARYAPYYIRNVRVSTHDPIYEVLRANGAPLTIIDERTAVCAFPVKAPKGTTVFSTTITAKEQLDYWLLNKTEWCEHSASATITYREHELSYIKQFLLHHQDVITGLSFLPAFDAQYDHMPYVEITESEYNERLGAFPAIDWSLLMEYESEDYTQAAQEIACVSGLCEI